MRAGHGSSLHIGIIVSGGLGSDIHSIAGHLRRNGGKYHGSEVLCAVIGFSSGGADVTARTVVGIVGGQAVRTQGRYADDVVRSTRIVGKVLGIVAGGEDGNISVQDWIVFSRLEVMDGIHFRSASGIIVSIIGGVRFFRTEGAGYDGSAVVRRVFDGF